MKLENHHDPIKDLAKRLREHSVPYREGAWEQFEARKQKKTQGLWPYFSVAAVLLIAITLFWKPQQQILLPEFAEKRVKQGLNDGADLLKEGKEPLIKENAQPFADENRNALIKKGDSAAEKRELLAFETEGNINVLIEEGRQQLEVASIAVVSELDVFTTVELEEKALREAEPEQQAIASVGKDKQEASVIDKKASRDLLAELLKIEALEPSGPVIGGDKKWHFAVGVSPTVSSNNQVNMGGGLVLSYALSPKVSISSGISYLQIGAEREPFYLGGIQSSPNSLPIDGKIALVGDEKIKTLNRSNTRLGGLDIPFNINYQLSKKVYASAGFSIFNVLNERNLDLYHNRESTVAYLGDGRGRPEPIVRTFYSQESSAEKRYEGELNGFLNFSVGYSIPLSKKVGISLEPFFKIPMGYVGENDFNLSNGGLKLSTRF